MVNPTVKKKIVRLLAVCMAILLVLPMSALSVSAAESAYRKPVEAGGKAEPGTRDGKEFLSASIYGSGFETWDSGASGKKYQLCLTIGKDDVNMLQGLNTASYAYTTVFSYRPADTEEDWTYVITNPWSVYDWGDKVIYRIPLMDDGVNNLKVDQEYEINIQVYRNETAVGWAQLYLTYSAENKAAADQYISYLDSVGKALVTFEYGDFRTAEVCKKNDKPSYSFSTGSNFHKGGREYTFTGWDKAFASVTESTTYSAVGTNIGEWLAHIPGDVNADRKVDMQDVTTLINYLKDAATEVSKYTVDTNGDNKISVKDVSRQLRHLENGDVPLCVNNNPSMESGEIVDEWTKYNVKAGKTEEELGVLPVGQYKISLTVDGAEKTLGYKESDGTLVADEGEGINNIFGILYQVTGEYPYYVISPGDEIMLVLANKSKSYTPNAGREIVAMNRTAISNPETNKNWTTEDDNAYAQWSLQKNDDGTYSLYINTDKNKDGKSAYDKVPSAFCLSYKEGKFVLEKGTEATGVTHFKIEMTRRGSDQCLQYISDKGNITLRLPMTVKTRGRLTDARAQQWVNDIQSAYEAFIDLTSFVPYKNIIIKAYAPSSYMAYILGSSSPGSGSSYNTITVGTSGQMTANNSWFVTDIKCLVLRGWGEHRDVNFGILHEMGHMFDDGRAWKFETEMQTDLKLVYVLYKCGFSAVPSGNSPKTVYTVDNILDCYFAGGNLLKKSTSSFNVKTDYNIVNASGVFVRIAQDIGWDAYKKAFKWYQDNLYSSEVPSWTQYHLRFEHFVKKLSEFSGKDVKTLFEKNEYENLYAYYESR